MRSLLGTSTIEVVGVIGNLQQISGGRDSEFGLRCWHLTRTQGLRVGPTRYLLDGVHETFQHFALH